MISIIVVIPAYNCAPQIGRVLKGFNSNLLAKIKKIIIIDNRSNDDTIREARKAVEKYHLDSYVEIWQNHENYNLGGTHKIAFLTADKMTADYVAILHGDNQATTSELDDLIIAAENDPNASAILGTRFMKGSVLVNYDNKRIWGNRVINLLFSVLALRPSKDLGSGLNLFRVSDLRDRKYLGFSDTITFNIDLLLDYFTKKSKLQFVPITWTEEDQVSNARNFNVGRTAIIKLLRWRIGRARYHRVAADFYKSERIA